MRLPPFWGGKPYVCPEAPRLLVSLDTNCSTLNYGLGEMFIDMTYGEKGRQFSVFASKFDRTLTGPVGLLLPLVFLAPPSLLLSLCLSTTNKC